MDAYVGSRKSSLHRQGKRDDGREYKKKMHAYNGGLQESRLDELLEIDDEEEEEEEEETKEKSPPPPPPTTKAACTSSETDYHDLGELVADRFLKFRDAIIKDYLASKTFEKELEEYKGSEEHKKSEKYKKELSELLERYKKSEDFRKALTHHLEMHKKSEKYKKSEDFRKTLSQYLEMHKKSEEYKKELADQLEKKYKGSKEHKDIGVQEVVGSFIQGLPAAQGRIYDLLRNRFPDLDIASCGLPAETEVSTTSHRSLVNEIKFLLLLLPFLLPLLLRPTEALWAEEETVNLRELITKKMR